MDPKMDSGHSQIAQLSPPAAKHAWFTYSTGDRPLEGYTIKRGVGAGGFGEVYYAVSDGGKEVALKQIQRHLDVELRGVSQCLNLKHPNLVVLYDVKQSDRGENWVVMEFVSGENLAELIERHPDGMPEHEVLRILRGICDGVGYLHEHGIVHRDLKPGNIFIENGAVKIGDYGLAKFISASRRSGQTESVGTVHYMAPELAHGRYGKEIDLYAVGIILHEMLTGRVPFVGQSPGEILMKHLTAQPDVQVLPAAFQPVVARLLSKAPEARYPSFEAMLADLDDCLAGRPRGAAAVPPIPPKMAGEARVHNVAGGPSPEPPPFHRAPSLQFWMDDVHGGFSTAEGIIRLAGDSLALDFRVKPLGMVQMALQELRIPLIDVDWVQLREGWFTTKLVLNAIRPQALANLPTTGVCQATFRLARTDREAARDFVAAVTEARGGAARFQHRPITLGPAYAGADESPRAAGTQSVPAEDRIVRPRDDRVWLGVCSALAARIGIDPVPIRVLWVLATFFSGFLIFLLAYLLLAMVIPESSDPSPIAPGRGRIRRLVRPRTDRKWAGVCSGIAVYFGLDPVWIRIPVAVATALTGFFPGLALYLVFCWAMPEGEPAAVAQAPPIRPERHPGSARYLGKVMLRLPIALACGGGVGAIVGATCQLLGHPWHDATAALIGSGAGLFTASVILGFLCRSLGKPNLFWPVLTTLMVGAGTGLVTGGALTTVSISPGYLREAFAAFGGVGAGLLVASFTGYLLYALIGRPLRWRWLFVVLYLGGAAGFLTAAAGALLGAHDEVIALSSIGAGLLTAGGLTWLLVFFGWAERLQPATATSPPEQNLNQTMTWYGSKSSYRPALLGTGMFLSVLLVAWSGAYGVFRLAGTRHSLGNMFVTIPAPAVVDWEAMRLGGHSATVRAVVFDQSGDRLATGDANGTITIWDLHTNARLHMFNTDGGSVNALVFSHDGGLLAAATNGVTVHIWDSESGELRCSTDEHPGPVKSIAFNPEGTQLVTGSVDDAVRIFDTESGKPIRLPFFGCKSNIESVAFLSDGQRILAVGHNDTTVRMWDVATGKQGRPFSVPDSWLSSFVLSPDGNRMATRDFSGGVIVWDVESREHIASFQIGVGSSLIAFSPDGRQLIAPDWPNANLYDVLSGRVLCSFRGHSGSLTALAFHPDGDYVATASNDNSVRLWEVPELLRRTTTNRNQSQKLLIIRNGAHRRAT